MALEIWLIEGWESPWILTGYFVFIVYQSFKDFEILKFLKTRYLYLFLVLEKILTIFPLWIRYYFGVQMLGELGKILKVTKFKNFLLVHWFWVDAKNVMKDL